MTEEGNIVDLVNQKYRDKTWSIQIRVDPCALAELAMYFDRLDGTVRTKSMLGAVIVETLRMVLRDNELLGENVTDVIRAMEVLTPEVGRNPDELLRQIKAFQHVAETGEVTPSGWQPGETTLTPGPDLVGKVWEVWKP